METFEKAVDPDLFWKLQYKRTKTETFENDGLALRILNNRVNNNIMLIVVPIDMYR